VGVLGKVTSSIRQGGTGEIVYTQGGTRHATGARSEDSSAIAKGSEVVVTRYEHGIAYVRRRNRPPVPPPAARKAADHNVPRFISAVRFGPLACPAGGRAAPVDGVG